MCVKIQPRLHFTAVTPVKIVTSFYQLLSLISNKLSFFPSPLFCFCWIGYHFRSSGVSLPLVLGDVAHALFDLASAAARKPALCVCCSLTTPKCGLLINYSLLQNHLILLPHLQRSYFKGAGFWFFSTCSTAVDLCCCP